MNKDCNICQRKMICEKCGKVLCKLDDNEKCIFDGHYQSGEDSTCCKYNEKEKGEI